MATAVTAGASPVVAASSEPPIVYFLHLLQQVFSALLALVSFVARTAVAILNPFLSPVSIFLYLLSPVFVLTNIILDVFVVTPYRIVAWILHAMYPVYVLVSTAFICACVIGLGARLVIHVAKMVLLRSPSSIQAPSIQVTEPEEDEKPKKKVQKRVSIKEERPSVYV
ncbi:hypothetical protein EIP91_008374 [Steccherinum ochraceum]|uniref:Uncharacterized protein n=1 Tax=Steccherinum ochraceum TaxID=92696 RepID=A0A4R0R2Z4_9APHY|nr:hypothetical protein EIP91_008374 [Steccherinum ochraceum]